MQHNPIRFMSRQITPNQYSTDQTHDYGELYYSYQGIMELIIGEQRYIAPKQYCLWLPPQTTHRCACQHKTQFFTLHIDAQLACYLPSQVCVLSISPLLHSIFEHLNKQPAAALTQPDNQRLLRVAYDQLCAAPCSANYLPTSDDPLLTNILALLEQNPADNRSIAQLAKQVNTTERTLMRHAQTYLGMSLTEWKQRLRVTKAITLLHQGVSIESIAFDLGYASASAFIMMFRKVMGVTPGQLRQESY